MHLVRPQGIGVHSVTVLVVPALTTTDFEICEFTADTVYLPGVKPSNSNRPVLVDRIDLWTPLPDNDTEPDIG